MGTTTTTFALNKPTVGGDDNAWGTDWNTNADKLDDLLDGTTAIKPNLSEGLWKVGGTAVTATAAELNKLDGLLPTTTELNFVDGVTSAIQTQLNAKSPIDNPTFTGDVTAPDIRLTSTGDASLVSTTHAFQIGADASLNLIADSNEIQARSNGAASALNINRVGGNVTLGGGTASSTITINGLASGAGLASQAEAEAGTANDKLMTPVRVADAIAALGRTATYQSAEQVVTAASNFTLTHSLGGLPSNVQAWLVCKTTEGGYAVNDWLGPIGSETFGDGANNGIVIAMNTTQIKVQIGSQSVSMPSWSTGARFTITPANWRIVVRAWK